MNCTVFLLTHVRTLFAYIRMHVYSTSSHTLPLWPVFPVRCSQVVDWDDRMRSVKWVTASETPVEPDVNGVTNASSRPPSVLAGRPVTAPAKRKVVETEPEPPHTVVEDSQRTLGLVVSGVVDYCKYECSVDNVKFKDTLMYQTRYYRFEHVCWVPVYLWEVRTYDESLVRTCFVFRMFCLRMNCSVFMIIILQFWIDLMSFAIHLMFVAQR